MCLAVPAKLVELRQNEAVADLHGNRIAINTLLVPEVKLGDWVLIHAGFAIQRMDAKEAEETWAVLEDIAEAGEEGNTERRTSNVERRTSNTEHRMLDGRGGGG